MSNPEVMNDGIILAEMWPKHYYYRSSNEIASPRWSVPFDTRDEALTAARNFDSAEKTWDAARKRYEKDGKRERDRPAYDAALKVWENVKQGV